jgi:hypothetical protein
VQDFLKSETFLIAGIDDRFDSFSKILVRTKPPKPFRRFLERRYGRILVETTGHSNRIVLFFNEQLELAFTTFAKQKFLRPDTDFTKNSSPEP